MSRSAFLGARILADGQWLDGHALLVHDGVIAAIVAEADVPSDAEPIVLDGGQLLPGFIDTQVNGGGGVLFNDQASVKGVRTIAAAHRQYGTTALLPTLISDDLDVVGRGIKAVDEAITSGVPGIIGIHIEGPFLNSGKRGIHNADTFRILDMAAVELLASLKHGKTLATLAPELAPPGMIKALVDSGVVVAAGHSLATYDDMQRAIDEGLSGVTHLFNAMTQMEGRAPGVVGAALESHLYCGLIVDGHHVDPASLRAAYRAKGPGELMLVTDAMSLTGTGETHFLLGDREITAADGALRSADGTLAGSALDMALALRNAVAMMNIDLPRAAQMASSSPAAFLGLDHSYGKIAVGYRADMVLLDADMQVRRCWIGGQEA
jgi:N-acetylglucosamine-6-phosphate deacetylase